MAENILSKGTLFPAEVVTEMFNKVKGKSSLAVLATRCPSPSTATTSSSSPWTTK